MAHLLGAEGLHLQFPTRTVFDSVSLGVDEGDRIGVVGHNGDGKSSLLAMLTGRLEPDAGRVTRRGGLRVTMLDQDDTLNDDDAVGHAIVGDRQAHEWAGDAKVRNVIAGLVADLDWRQRLAELSGGQRRRVALAAVLAGSWDVIGLDEPTNHLDVEGIGWLAQHLNTRWARGAGGLVVVTHDRWFLDAVCTKTWEVHDGIVEPFDGGYAAYILQRVERDRQAQATFARRQNLLRKELAWLRRGAPARTSKPKFRIEAANELIADVPAPRDRTELARLATARLGKDVVDLENVSVRFGERTILDDVTWRLGAGDRVAVLGSNGAGKSTLLNVIAGSVTPSTGRRKLGKTVRLGMLDQRFSQLEEIAGDRVHEVLARARTSYVIDGAEYTPAQLLERLGFSSAHLSARVSDLSGGQRRRLQLLMLLLDEPNVLILDEPTNDVDTQMLAAMEDLLDSWPGTLIVVSHDRYLIERVTDDQYAIIGGHLRHVPGGVDEYLGLSPTPAESAPAESAPVQAPPGDPRPSKPAQAELRQARKDVSAAERRIDKLTEQAESLESAMAVHDPRDYEGLTALHGELEQVKEQLAQAEERWLELSELIQAGI